MGYVVKRSTGIRAREIAFKNNLPIGTVETVIKDYLESLQTSALNHEAIVLDGLTSIRIIYDEGTDEFVPRGRVSDALKSKLKQAGNNKTPVES